MDYVLKTTIRRSLRGTQVARLTVRVWGDQRGEPRAGDGDGDGEAKSPW